MRKFPFIILVLLLSWEVSWAQGTRVGIVNMSFLVANAPQAISVKKRLEREFEPRQEVIEDCLEELKQLQVSVRKASESKNAEQTKRQVAKFQKKQRRCAELRSEFQEDLNKRNNSEMKSFLDLVVGVTDTIAMKRKLDLVLKAEAALFVTDKVNITTEVLQGLERRKNGASKSRKKKP